MAVVGCSPRPERPSHQIASYLLANGYTVVPVNPGHCEILGQRCYQSLLQIPAGVTLDIVNVFRRSEEVAPVADEAISRGAGFFFMQQGVMDVDSALRLERAGIPVAMDRCIMVEHARSGLRPRIRNAAGQPGVFHLGQEPV